MVVFSWQRLVQRLVLVHHLVYLPAVGQMLRESRKPVKESRQKKIITMKKSIHLLVFAFLSVLSFAQSNTIPSSVSALGQQSVEDYLQLTNITGSFEASIFTSQTQFKTVNEIVSASYNNCRIPAEW